MKLNLSGTSPGLLARQKAIIMHREWVGVSKREVKAPQSKWECQDGQKGW